MKISISFFFIFIFALIPLLSGCDIFDNEKNRVLAAGTEIICEAEELRKEAEKISNDAEAHPEKVIEIMDNLEKIVNKICQKHGFSNLKEMEEMSTKYENDNKFKEKTKELVKEKCGIEL